MKVLVVAFHYFPSNAIGAARMDALAAFLRQQGHEVMVITAAYDGPPSETNPQDYYAHWFDVRRLKFVAPGSRSGLVARTTAPSDPMHPVVLAGHSTQASRSPRIRRLLARARHLTLSADGQVGWIPGAVLAGVRLLRKGWHPDVIVASAPPYSSLAVGSALSAISGAPWIADYRDLWTAGTYYTEPNWRRLIEVRLERRILGGAAIATTTSYLTTSTLRSSHNVNANTVLNGWDPYPTTPISTRVPIGAARLNLLYVGNALYDGRRSPALLLRAAAALHLSKDDIAFNFLGTDPSSISSLARELGVEGLVRFWPATDRAGSLAFQSRADALMLLTWNDPREAGVISGKIFEYIAVRRPIIMVGYPHGEMAEMVEQNALGSVVNSESQAIEALTRLLSAKSSPALGPDLPSENGQGLSRAQQNIRMESLLREVVTKRQTPRRR